MVVVPYSTKCSYLPPTTFFSSFLLLLLLLLLRPLPTRNATKANAMMKERSLLPRCLASICPMQNYSMQLKFPTPSSHKTSRFYFWMGLQCSKAYLILGIYVMDLTYLLHYTAPTVQSTLIVLWCYFLSWLVQCGYYYIYESVGWEKLRK